MTKKVKSNSFQLSMVAIALMLVLAAGIVILTIVDGTRSVPRWSTDDHFNAMLAAFATTCVAGATFSAQRRGWIACVVCLGMAALLAAKACGMI